MHLQIDSVRKWLENLQLGIYAEAFEISGWDDIESIKLMTEDDVKHIVGKPGHVRKIHTAMLSLKEEDCFQETKQNASLLTFNN